MTDDIDISPGAKQNTLSGGSGNSPDVIPADRLSGMEAHAITPSCGEYAADRAGAGDPPLLSIEDTENDKISITTVLGDNSDAQSADYETDIHLTDDGTPNVAVGDDTAPPPASSVSDPGQPAKSVEVAALRAELEQLRGQIAARIETYERMAREYDEFREIFPGRDMSSLSEEVWEGVRQGLPLAAAYAYEEAKQKKRREIAAEVNRKNSNLSSGAIDGRGGGVFFSPGEVRAMSAAEVRSNYDKIIGSMKLWS